MTMWNGGDLPMRREIELIETASGEWISKAEAKRFRLKPKPPFKEQAPQPLRRVSTLPLSTRIGYWIEQLLILSISLYIGCWINYWVYGWVHAAFAPIWRAIGLH